MIDWLIDWLDWIELNLIGFDLICRTNDVDAWTRSFLKAMHSSLLDTPLTGAEPPLILTTAQDFDSFLVPHIDNTEKLVLLLDYDGTLAPIAPHPDMAIIPNETKRVLQRLANCPDVYIALISGRGVANVKSMVGIDNITYAGNHGLEILHPDGTRFTHPLPAGNEETISRLFRALQEQVCRDGAWVENKGVLLTYHYRYPSMIPLVSRHKIDGFFWKMMQNRETPEEIRPELIARAKQLIEESGFKCFPALCALEAKPAVEWDKGRAAVYILRTTFGVDWNERVRIIFAGDDVGDEDAIVALKGYWKNLDAVCASCPNCCSSRFCEIDWSNRWNELVCNRRHCCNIPRLFWHSSCVCCWPPSAQHRRSFGPTQMDRAVRVAYSLGSFNYHSHQLRIDHIHDLWLVQSNWI